MDFDDLESVYERLATAIDETGPDASELFLAKVALMLARELEDRGKVLAIIEDCLPEGAELRQGAIRST